MQARSILLEYLDYGLGDGLLEIYALEVVASRVGISLIFDLPDVLIGHFVHHVAEGLVELEEEHQGHEIRSVVKPEAYEDVFIVQDDTVKEEHYAQLDGSHHEQF